MIVGAWIHEGDGISVDRQIPELAKTGMCSIRCYDYAYAQRAASSLKKDGLSLLAGLHVDGPGLVRDWQSQLHLEEIQGYHQLNVKIEAICVGNEIREGGDAPGKKKFTANLSHNLVKLLSSYHLWLEEYGFTTPLTYAMEGIVFDETGHFLDWVWPVIEVCDIVGVNSYPMKNEGWFTFGAFDESRRFLQDHQIRREQLEKYEERLRLLLEQLKQVNRPLILTEAGFPSAVGYHLEGKRLVIPESDYEDYFEAMQEFVQLLLRLDQEYGHLIRGLYFYEWRDNLYHDKIWNVEGSPIHVAFGLCDRFGKAKVDIKKLVSMLG